MKGFFQEYKRHLLRKLLIIPLVISEMGFKGIIFPTSSEQDSGSDDISSRHSDDGYASKTPVRSL